MVVNVWLECKDVTDEFECILALGDSTSAIGWLFSMSSFPANSPAHKAHHLTARQLARLLINHNHCLASQHLNGKLNILLLTCSPLWGTVGGDLTPSPLTTHPTMN
jgi:hypothetical protein